MTIERHAAVAASTTTLYFVRHADSPYLPGQERTRGLSERGSSDALRVCRALMDVRVDTFVSSPYERAIRTIGPLAGDRELAIIEDLRERDIGVLSDTDFQAAKAKVYEDFDFAYPGGESSRSAQRRAVRAVLDLLRVFQGGHVLLGTHGDIMTLIFNYFDPSVHYAFWQSTTMPDIYKLEFEGERLVTRSRLWRTD
ncbi:histidine phosphatase family protein [Cohnella sp. 56]|uniref:histidine phosphatase family protein n=1 Tax=Cohnella sp. 56 TaxID=3113722 RepID=UPI0030EA88B9